MTTATAYAPPRKLHRCPYCTHRRFLTAERMDLHIREKHKGIAKKLAEARARARAQATGVHPSAVGGRPA